LPVDDQLMFVTGYKPMRVKKVRYFNDPIFMKRVLPAPEQSASLNVPTKPKIDWLHERPKGPELALPAPSHNGLSASGGPTAESDEDTEQDAADQGLHSESEYT
jgi:type IV secretion system protein VirD4